jgi:mRNA interferase RelE/StbE
MTYQIEFEKQAAKQFRALSDLVQQRILPKIDALASDPRGIGSVKLAGTEDLYRIRVGDYRIIYSIQDDLLLILVVKIGHRRDVYR